MVSLGTIPMSLDSKGVFIAFKRFFLFIKKKPFLFPFGLLFLCAGLCFSSLNTGALSRIQIDFHFKILKKYEFF
jgi:hypothetical protein